MKRDDLQILLTVAASSAWIVDHLREAERVLAFIDKGAPVLQVTFRGSVALDEPDKGSTDWIAGLFPADDRGAYFGQRAPAVCDLDNSERAALKHFLELRISRLSNHLAQQKVRIG